jgi:excisionase family DNA binding protein
MTLEEVAKHLSCSDTTVYRLVQQREIPGFKLGRRTWRFLRSDIDKWISDQQAKRWDAGKREHKGKGRPPNAKG